MSANYLYRCPRCKLENYCMMVPEGICAWCNWPNEDSRILKGRGAIVRMAKIYRITGAFKL